MRRLRGAAKTAIRMNAAIVSEAGISTRHLVQNTAIAMTSPPNMRHIITVVGGSMTAKGSGLSPVRRQNIMRRWLRKLAEYGPRHWFDIMRRACGAASAVVRWSFALSFRVV